jgi:hypothetical protein
MGAKGVPFLETLFAGAFGARAYARLGEDPLRRIVAGGYPAALIRATARRRAT